MSNMNTTPKYFTPPQCPPLLRRATITPSSQRPSTSGGEGIEPKSDFLRDALRERKGLPPRSQSTTPRRAKTVVRTYASQMAHDELFLPSSDDEAKLTARRGPTRPQRTRRASDVNSLKPSPNSQVRNLGHKEAESHMDKLLKENWDLKHRIMLRDQAFSKLRAEMDEALVELERNRELINRNRDLEEAIEMVSREAADVEEENRALKINNAELTVLNDELLREMEVKDEGIQQRQLAIEEAAGIIQSLEQAKENLKKQYDSPEAASDYFSGEVESTSATSTSLRPTTAATCGTDFSNAPDSDYFSGESSPTLTATTPKKTQSGDEQEKALQLERARAMGAAFNREIGLRCQASKDSLLSIFLQTPVPEPSKLAQRNLRRRLAAPVPPSPPRIIIREELQRSGTPPWSDSRELRTVYEQGGLNRRIGSFTSLRRRGYTPSVTVASTSASIDDIFSLSEAQQSISSLATTISSSATEGSAVSNNTTTTHRPLTPTATTKSKNPTPVNYAVWPRQLPEWPPSAGLKNRDILFHGSGMHDMFPSNSSNSSEGETSPIQTRPSSSRENTSFSNVLLLRTSTGSSRHERSLSAAPRANAFVPPPPPPMPLLSQRTSTAHRFPNSMTGLRRPGGLERSRTVPFQ